MKAQKARAPGLDRRTASRIANSKVMTDSAIIDAPTMSSEPGRGAGVVGGTARPGPLPGRTTNGSAWAGPAAATAISRPAIRAGTAHSAALIAADVGKGRLPGRKGHTAATAVRPRNPAAAQ